MNERWRQFYDTNGGYGMRYEEESARQKLAYLRHREDWFEEHHSRYQIPPWAYGYFLEAVADSSNDALLAGAEAALKTTMPGSDERTAFEGLLGLLNEDANKALRVVTAATATAATTKTGVPSWKHFAPPYPEIAECSDSIDAISVPSEKAQITQVTGCFCGRKDTKTRMLLCDSSKCDLFLPTGRWLHFKCVGVTREPETKKWYCPWCQADRLLRGKKEVVGKELGLSDQECSELTKVELGKRLRIRASEALGLGRRESPLSSELAP